MATQRAELDAIEPSDAGLTALWYSSGDDTPYVGAGIGAPQMIMDAAGLENIAADVEDTWTSMGWEAIVAADPDVIVLVDAAWNTAEQKIAHLESNPATAALPAVQQQRYLVRRLPGDRGGRAQRRRRRVARRPARGARAADEPDAVECAAAGAACRGRRADAAARRVPATDAARPPRRRRPPAPAPACAPARGRLASACCSWHPSSSP